MRLTRVGEQVAERVILPVEHVDCSFRRVGHRIETRRLLQNNEARSLKEWRLMRVGES